MPSYSIKSKMALMRFYLDYNSTHPLLDSIPHKLGAICDVNPSSQHSSGKNALRQVKEVQQFLLNFFNLSSLDYTVLFHSGATEFFNTVFRESFVYAQGDHSALQAIAKRFECVQLPYLDKRTRVERGRWLNYQWMNNETGCVQSLDVAAEIKKNTQCLVHVDAVQTVGKIKDFTKLNKDLDIYTFSGHKFGALKGIGFSFVKKSVQLFPLIAGGGQQQGLRSGTLNLHGILSLKWALESVDHTTQMTRLAELKEKIILLVGKHPKLEYISNASVNTVCLIHKTLKSDAMLIHFDLAGLEVSTGSACTSGSLRPSQTLLAMGYGEKANQAIRISLGASNLPYEEKLLEKLEMVFSKL